MIFTIEKQKYLFYNLIYISYNEKEIKGGVMKTKFKSITAFLIYIFLPTIMLNLYGVDKTYFIGESIYVTQWLLIYIDFVTVTALSLL